VLLLNRSAETLLQKDQAEIEGQGLSTVSPELDEFMRGDQSEANVLIVADSGQRTLAVKRVRYRTDRC
jgi:two-component system nitrogen regulation sensor histidine kinase NtrY